MSGTPPLAGPVDRLLAPRLEQRILPGLDRIARALATLNHPEDRFPSLLVVGTNGKGSTVALLASILRAHGLRVGRYTSPHLIRVEERIEVDGTAIDSARLLELIRELEAFPDLSYFETVTAAAFLEFADREVDIAVLEAGLGGRWDATNAGAPEVAMLTNVGTDHGIWLGPTRRHIAAEKAAALRGREAIIGEWDDEIEAVIRAHADPATPVSLAGDWAEVWGEERSEIEAPAVPTLPSRPSPLPFIAAGTPVGYAVAGLNGAAFLPLLGAHQIANLRLALAGAAALAKHRAIPPLDACAVTDGIESTRWPGRLQRVSWAGRDLFLDGAHNLEATHHLSLALDALRLSGRVEMVFSCLDDKPLDAMAARLRPRVTGVTVVPLASPRAMPVERLTAAFPGCRTASTLADAVDAAGRETPLLVTGSLRLVGEMLGLIGRNDG
ncbi:MAG: bifunctional folylpolyglutamate synthase/dihydrofolate synthase [Acidobacteriota bacterium]